MTSPSTLTQAVDNAITSRLVDIHTAFPGQIVEYDFTKKLAKIQPVINKKYATGEVQPMPILNNVPVIFPFSGGASITFPVNPGDFCLVICCERSIDNWLATGTQTAPADPRILDLSDGVAIMGLLPFTETSPAENNDDMLISYQGSSITIKKNGDVIINTSNRMSIGSNTTEILDVLSQTLGFLSASVTTVEGTPFEFATNWGALQTQIDALKIV